MRNDDLKAPPLTICLDKLALLNLDRNGCQIGRAKNQLYKHKDRTSSNILSDHLHSFLKIHCMLTLCGCCFGCSILPRSQFVQIPGGEEGMLEEN
jgi:hypothetical protein